MYLPYATHCKAPPTPSHIELKIVVMYIKLSLYIILGFPGFSFCKKGNIEHKIHKQSKTAPMAIQYFTPTLFIIAVDTSEPAPKQK